MTTRVNGSLGVSSPAQPQTFVIPLGNAVVMSTMCFSAAFLTAQVIKHGLSYLSHRAHRKATLG